MQIRIIKQFLKLESSSSLVLFLSTLLSMILANSPLRAWHQEFVDLSLFWVNEGLMAIFFLLVGIELRRGYLVGQFSQWSQVFLPAIAAVGGMICPALIYYLINFGNPLLLQGWATPVATDIAFAVGVLSLFNHRLSFALKLFLLSLAIFDDIGAILIIIFFFSHHLSMLWLGHSLILVGILYAFNRIKIQAYTPYFLIGVLLWFALLRAGIHPTLTGILLAFMLPAKGARGLNQFKNLEVKLHPWVAFLIMPLFALANAGFDLSGLGWSAFNDKLVLGIIAGLFIGKQIGVFGFSWLAIRLKWADLPEKTSWLALYGVSLLCGIGFTMSLFLGTLSFQNSEIFLAEIRLGVIVGSILSGLAGASVLALAVANTKRRK